MCPAAISPSSALYKLRLPDGRKRLARGSVAAGPSELLPEGLELDALVAAGSAAIAEASESPGAGSIPDGSALLPPLGTQEVWAAGVTYLQSRDGRIEEAADAGDCYARVYDADRPELFFKAAATRVRGDGERIGVREDSSWNVPEPELGLVVSPDMRVVAYTIGNDVSSRSIEGENPLYLPQAKVYDGACSIGPGIVAAELVDGPFEIELEIRRGAAIAYSGATSTRLLKRRLEELCEYLGRCLTFPTGAVLLTGTALVPAPPFTLEPGDEVAIRIEGLGELRNEVELIHARATGVALT